MKHDTTLTYLSTHELSTGETESLVWNAYQSNAVKVQAAVLVALGFICWSGTQALFPPPIPDTVHFLDVGQGDAALITLAAESSHDAPIRILVDGGRDGSVLSALSAAQADSAFRYIDLIILSHQDTDHYGGLVRVLEQYDVGALISNGNEGTGDGWRTFLTLLESKNIPHHVLDKGDLITYADAKIEILLPTDELRAGESLNEASLVFSLSTFNEAGTTTVLFTGDIGHEAEQVLLAENIPLQADILKVGHHGSKHSSSAAFIHAVAPHISVISVGKNTYGHPAPEVLDTLTRAGSSVYTTLEHGTIRVPLNPATSPLPKTAERGFFASVFLGASNRDSSTTITLHEALAQEQEMTLVPVTTCSFGSTEGVTPGTVRINEVAWMGTHASASNEWIELLRTSDEPVDISGWQLVNENERVHATFPQGTILTESFAIAAKKNADEELSLDAETHFTGALRNTNESIRLFDNECRLVDEVSVSSSWEAGDNKTKRTMERLSEEVWVDSLSPGGTPRAHTSGNIPEEEIVSAATSTATVEKDASLLFAEFAQEKDGTMTVSVLAEELPSATYDLKVSIQYDGTDVSETMHPIEESWRSSLYYLPELFTGEMYDGTLQVRLRETYETFSGDAVLLVRLREHGKASYEEYRQDIRVQKVPQAKKEEMVTEKKTKTVATAPAPNKPTITASYPETIVAGEPFTVSIAADHFDPEPYDVKISIEHERVLSRTEHGSVWQSSQFYLPTAFTGPSVSDLPFSLLVPTSTEALPETAEVLVRARKQGKSGFVYFQGTIQITPPTASTTPETPGAEEQEEGTENNETGEPSEPEEEETPTEPIPEETLPVCIDINTAPVEELDTLMGIGPVLAERIITERESERGPFTSLDDLVRVSGIGTTSVENIRTEGKTCPI